MWSPGVEIAKDASGQANPNLVTGRVALNRLENVAKSGTIEAQLVTELEAQGLLFRNPPKQAPDGS
jgi:hypothetical protein